MTAMQRQRQILVTGGAGFIGSNFIRFILADKQKEYKIVNMDNLSEGGSVLNIRDFDAYSNYKFIQKDIETLSKDDTNLISNCDMIFNFAAQTHVDRSIANIFPFMKSNIQGVANLLELIRQFNDRVKFIHVSTDEVYGDVAEGASDENSILRPSNPYSATKAASDLLCISYFKTYGLDVLVTRCANNFGPFQMPEKFIPKTIIRTLKGLPVSIYGNGENIRDWIYVNDHCDAIKFLAENGTSGEIYNISSHNHLRNIDLVRNILETMKMPQTTIKYVEDRPGHDKRYSIDTQKITSLGWKTRSDFQQSLNSTIQWYMVNKEWWSNFANDTMLREKPWVP